ncbi:BnaA04g13780D [Brassica napus]|uniref:BnaA04g13780D protein n=1 Tax=Brassica napus TaxID=3708 RepID=A0A078HM33_BRANA|nr:BnaA04g13780D [Brassica napus]
MYLFQISEFVLCYEFHQNLNCLRFTESLFSKQVSGKIRNLGEPIGRCLLQHNISGTLALTSMASSRVFLDYDVQPTKEYIGWLGSNPDIAKQVNAVVVTKTETLTIGEIFSYMKQEATKGNGNKEDGFEVPVPHALLNTIGYTHKFNVKIQLLALVNEILATGDDASEPAKIPQACADVGLKRMGDGVEKGNPKRSKDGN